ncbi:hypothetical protein ACHAXT_011573 [Thalassiosira profunda]
MSYHYPNYGPQQPPQRGGPVVNAPRAPVPVRTVPAQRAAPAPADSGKVHPAGRGANAALAILDGAAETGSKKRKASDAAEALDRLIPPLFTCSKVSAGGEADATAGDAEGRGDAGDGESSKKARGDGEADQEVATGESARTKQLKEELEKHKKHNELLMKRRNNVFKSMVALHEMYETGLDGIARMNDLRFCPDNVMPDEIPR